MNKCKIFKILISFSIGFVILNCVSNINANMITDIERISKIIGLNIDQTSKIDLYNENEEIIANYYSGVNNGYLIVNAQNNEPLEYSFENKIDFIEQETGKYYYAGLLNYYKRNDENTLINDKSNIILNEELQCINLTNTFDASSFIKQETRALTTISHVPRAYSYNPNGICGATAAAIFLMYYDDYVNESYVPTSYESSGTGKTTVNYISPYINNGNPGSTYNDMINGINKYLKARGFGQTATKLIKTSVQTPITSNRPVIVGLTGHPTYGEHWVVGYGYSRYVEGTETIYMIVVSDGWGNTGKYINRNYSDGGIKI